MCVDFLPRIYGTHGQNPGKRVKCADYGTLWGAWGEGGQYEKSLCQLIEAKFALQIWIDTREAQEISDLSNQLIRDSFLGGGFQEKRNRRS